MEFAGRGSSSSAAAAFGDGGRRFPDPPPQHGDEMTVIRDALLSQLQKDRLRHEIIVAELAKIERDMALRSAAHHGGASAGAGRSTPAPFAFDDVHDPKKNDGVHGAAEFKSANNKPATEGPVRGCLKTSCGTGAATDACKCKPREPSEATPSKKKSPSVKWRCAICQVEATSEGNLLQHFAGQKHRSTVIDLKAKAKAEKSRKATKYADNARPAWVCNFCQANCTCKSDLENHLKGKRHQATIEALLEEIKRVARTSVSQETDSHPIWNCSICQVKWTSQSVRESHLRGKKHQMNLQALLETAKLLQDI
ncbi:hypothetical protein ACP70R_006396 [Stipagrostis hirtigluma subsp. patula]